jgi:hypothetical protein
MMSCGFRVRGVWFEGFMVEGFQGLGLWVWSLGFMNFSL